MRTAKPTMELVIHITAGEVSRLNRVRKTDSETTAPTKSFMA
jgi:hypothetical protein